MRDKVPEAVVYVQRCIGHIDLEEGNLWDCVVMPGILSEDYLSEKNSNMINIFKCLSLNRI